MKPTTHIKGKTIPLAMNDVDTDLIIPAEFLTSISKAGYGEHLFKRLRQANPDFPFNKKEFSGANICITQANFGCGSSREHAVWALQEAGIQVIIAESFADIFAGNSAKNGLLLITQPKEVITQLLQSANSGTAQLEIDIAQQTITTPNQEVFHFTMDPFRQHCFIHGLDDLDYLLSQQPQIAAYQQKQQFRQFSSEDSSEPSTRSRENHP